MSDERFGIFGLFIKNRRKRNFSFENILINSHCIVITEGINSSMHLINEYSESPPIDCFSMSLVENNFRCNVFRCSTYCESSTFIQNLCETKICKFEISIVSNQQILRFEIPKDNVLGVQVFETTSYSGGIKFALIGRKTFDWSQVSEKLSSIDQFQNQVKILRILSQTFKPHNERMVNLGVDEVLVMYVVNLLSLYYLCLLQKLEGNILPVFVVLGNLHNPEATWVRVFLPLPRVLPT